MKQDIFKCLMVCPFCGHHAEVHRETQFLYNLEITNWRVCCRNYQCSVKPTAIGRTLQQAAEKWNRRSGESKI